MELAKNIFYVGASTHELDLFEGQYIVPNGMAYNSYLLLDEKTVLFDTADKIVADAWLENVITTLNGRTLDYLVVQHMEPDHSSQIKTLVEKFPNIKIIGNAKTFSMLKNFFDYDFSKYALIVKDGEVFSTGSRELKFVFAPMVHWPEVMMTYDATTKSLFSADAFGKFGALDTDESWACEARRYYFNIVGKYGAQVQSLFKKIAGVEINNIFPLHGPYLQENLEYYLNLYNTWSSYQAEVSGVFIAYNSVYGNTEKACKKLYEILKEKGVKVSISDLARSDMAENLEDAFKYSHLVIGATTYENGVFPVTENFIQHLLSKNYQNRTLGIIENGSWAPMAGKHIVKFFENSKNIKLCDTIVTINSALNENSLAQLEQLAEELN